MCERERERLYVHKMNIRCVYVCVLTVGHESRVQGKCIAIPTRTTSFSKEKGAALGGKRTHDTLLYVHVNDWQRLYKMFRHPPYGHVIKLRV